MSNVTTEIKSGKLNISGGKSIQLEDRICFCDNYTHETSVKEYCAGIVCFNKDRFFVNYYYFWGYGGDREYWNLGGYEFTPEFNGLIESAYWIPQN